MAYTLIHATANSLAKAAKDLSDQVSELEKQGWRCKGGAGIAVWEMPPEPPSAQFIVKEHPRMFYLVQAMVE